MSEHILEELIEHRKRTRNACNRLTEKLKHAVAGRLRIVTKKGKRGAVWYQYYVSFKEGDLNGSYLPKAQISTAAAIAQRDYERALLEHKRHELAFLDKAISGYVGENAQSVYDALLPGRRILVTPEKAVTSEQAVAAWKRKRYKSNPFPEKPALMTDAGVLVRSKSEVLIANALWLAGLPFRYEYPVRLLHGELYYADFFILNPATGREFVWEHFGRMDDPGYCARTIKKISDYTCFMQSARPASPRKAGNATCPQRAPASSRKAGDADFRQSLPAGSGKADEPDVLESGPPFGFVMTFEDGATPLLSQQIEAQLALITG